MEPNFADLINTLAHVVGFVFGYAAIAKLFRLKAVADGMRSYELIPSPLLPLAVSLLIIGEALIAVTHLGLIALPAASAATVVLLTMFLGFTTYSILRGDKRPCLCFGAEKDNKVDGLTIARIISLLAAETAVLIAVLKAGPLALQSTGTATAIESLVAALVIVTLAGLIIAIPEYIVWWRMRPKQLLQLTSHPELRKSLFDPLLLN